MILVSGSLAFDYIMDFPGKFSDHILPENIHILNLSFLVDTLNQNRGGTAGNIAYNLALLKTPTSILAAVGEDFTDYNTFLKKAGIDTNGIKIIKGEKTASAFIMTDQKDNQLSAFYPGAIKESLTLSLKKLSKKPKMVVISPDNPSAMEKFVDECIELSIPYLYDPGMQLPRLSDLALEKGIKNAQILIGNDYEIALMKNRLALTDEQILQTSQILITTLGEKGARIQTKNDTYQIAPAKPIKVVDPTGAGDAFRGGFLAGFSRGLDLKICGQMGAIASCYAIEKYGTSNHSFTLEEFGERYKENFGEQLNLSSRRTQ